MALNAFANKSPVASKETAPSLVPAAGSRVILARATPRRPSNIAQDQTSSMYPSWWIGIIVFNYVLHYRRTNFSVYRYVGG